MKLLGLIGGVSPESTVIYYRLLNEAARTRLGGEHSANIVLYTLNYGTMIRHYDAGDWSAFIAEVVKGAKHLAAAGAEALVISSNTTHVAAEAALEATGLPLIHLLDALTDAMKSNGAKKPLLLGTPMVMSGDHYLPALAQRYDGEVLVPTAEEQGEIGRIILDELVRGGGRDPPPTALQAIIARHGADGVILGCTELCMILSQDHVDMPVFDTTALHASAASAYAFRDD
jgi:aspartate racemase